MFSLDIAQAFLIIIIFLSPGYSSQEAMLRYSFHNGALIVIIRLNIFAAISWLAIRWY